MQTTPTLTALVQGEDPITCTTVKGLGDLIRTRASGRPLQHPSATKVLKVRFSELTYDRI